TLANASKLAFEAGSENPAKLMVQVEELGGGKYNKLIEIPGAWAPQRISLDFSEFKAADDSKDSNGKLDLDQVNQLVLIDLTGTVDQVNEPNRLRIGDLRALTAK